MNACNANGCDRSLLDRYCSIYTLTGCPQQMEIGVAADAYKWGYEEVCTEYFNMWDNFSISDQYGMLEPRANQKLLELYTALTEAEMKSISDRRDNFIGLCKFAGIINGECERLRNNDSAKIWFSPQYGACFTYNFKDDGEKMTQKVCN